MVYSVFLFFTFETGFLCVALEPVLELALVDQTRLASNSQRSACLWLPSTGIKGVHHHRPAKSNLSYAANQM